MISFKSGAIRGLWCSSCCAAWGAHGWLMSMTIKVLWELRGPAGSGFFAVMSITQALSCGLPHPISLRLGSLHFPQCLLPHQTPVSRIYPPSLSFAFTQSLLSPVAKERRWGIPWFWVRIVRGPGPLKCDLSQCRPANVIYSGLRSSLGCVQCCGLLNLALLGLDFTVKPGFIQQCKLYLLLKAKLLVVVLGGDANFHEPHPRSVSDLILQGSYHASHYTRQQLCIWCL